MQKLGQDVKHTPRNSENSNTGTRYRDPNRDRDRGRNRRESKECAPDTDSDSDSDFDCTDELKMSIAGYGPTHFRRTGKLLGVCSPTC